VTLKEDLIIGMKTDREDYWFSRLNCIAVDDDGNIYTLDPKDIKIRVFDAKGILLRNLGRKGQGPGEFTIPSWMDITPQKTIVVKDIANGRISFLTLEGKSLRDISAGGLALVGLKVDHKGFFYSYKTEVGYNPVDELCKFDQDLKPIVKFHSFANPRKPGVINPYPAKFFYGLTKEDNLVWIVSLEYQIFVVDAIGKTVRKIIKEYTPAKITEKDKERFTKSDAARRSPIQIKYEFPENYPAVDGLFLDDRDRIYIKTFEKDGKGGIYYDVFDPDGRYFARFSLPETDRITIVKNNKIYCMIQESAEGVPLVKRYAVEWK